MSDNSEEKNQKKKDQESWNSVQLIKTENKMDRNGKKSRRFILDHEALESVLRTAKSPDLPIAVISIGQIRNNLKINT